MGTSMAFYNILNTGFTIEDLAKKIKALLTDNSLYEKLKSEGKEQYNKYQGKYIAKKLEGYYNSLLD